MSKTLAFILLIVASIIIFDFYIILNEGATSSISAYLIRLSREYSSIPFLVGFVAGHIFWNTKDIRIYKEKDD